MNERMETPESRAIYARRKNRGADQELGISGILRGKEKVAGEFSLVCVARKSFLRHAGVSGREASGRVKRGGRASQPPRFEDHGAPSRGHGHVEHSRTRSAPSRPDTRATRRLHGAYSRRYDNCILSYPVPRL